MENISANLEALQNKIEKLIHLHRSASEKNKNLLSERQELLTKLKNNELVIHKLNENYQVLKITKVLAEAPIGTNADARSKINELVREIDKCIALLNK